jgi:hypothetical protein
MMMTDEPPPKTSRAAPAKPKRGAKAVSSPPRRSRARAVQPAPSPPASRQPASLPLPPRNAIPQLAAAAAAAGAGQSQAGTEHGPPRGAGSGLAAPRPDMAGEPVVTERARAASGR